MGDIGFSRWKKSRRSLGRCEGLQGRISAARLLWNQVEFFPVGQTEHVEVTPIEGEHRFYPFAIRQMHKRCIRKLYSQAPILGNNRGNAGKIRLSQRSKPEGPAMEGCQERQDRLRVCTQEPCRLGNHWPTSQQRGGDVVQLLDTSFMVLIGFQQYGYDWARIDENPARQEPNPSKYFGLVLRSRTLALTAPINPAFFACS